MKPNVIPRVEHGNAICYSGYREGQSPDGNNFPSREQVVEDLQILSMNWKYLRLYDCSRHAELVLDVIRGEGLDFRVMLGANMRAEESNPHCPWGAQHDEEGLAANRLANSVEIDRMVELASEYVSEGFAVSVGNEASVEWTDHLVSVERLVGFVRQLKGSINSKGKVVVGTTGNVEGDIVCQNADISGTIKAKKNETKKNRYVFN